MAKRDPYWLTARFASKCAGCNAAVAKGERIFYYPERKRAFGEACGCASKNAADFEAAIADEDFWNG